jgi:N4-gp56 family major capsid protein
MATTQYGVNHPLAVKLWSKKLFQEALKETFISRFMGSGTDALIQVKDDLSKSAGDRIRCGLRMQLSGAGVAGDDTLEGQEEALTTYSDNIFIDQLRHAVRSDGKMSEQRVPFSVREEAMMGLRDWWADRMDTAFFNQIAGNTGQADTRYTGSQATTAPTSNTGNMRIIYGVTETTENSLSASASASNNFQLTLIDRAIVTAKTATPLIRPLRIGGNERYVLFLHPHQVYSLRTDATAGRVTWYDTQKARVQGGEMDNPIFSGALGEYNGVIIHQATRIPLAPNTTTVRRAVFCGAQAASMATGREHGEGRMTYYEELFDYGNQLGVEAGMIWGLKKLVFNNIDFGTIVISTHAEAP